MFNELNEWALCLVASRDRGRPVTAVSVSAHGFLLRVQSGAEPMQDEQVAWHEVEQVLAGTLPASQWHSPLWPMRWIFTSEWLSRVFERAVRYEQRVF